MNYNTLTPIIVNVVSKKNNIIKGRYTCDQYTICNEYLSQDVSQFTITDLAEMNLTKNWNPVPFTVNRTEEMKVVVGDYVYVSKNDGSNIVPQRTSALYVGTIVEIDGHVLMTRSILTLLDMDSVVGLQGMYPYYNWAAMAGYTTGRFLTDNPVYAMMDCDTILALIQSMEYALGQSPKHYSFVESDLQPQWGTKYFVPYLTPPKPYPITWSLNKSSGLALPSGFKVHDPSNSYSIGSPWWSNGKKIDILFDCPTSYMQFGRRDPDYMFNVLNFSLWYGKLKVDPLNGTTDYYQTIRYSMSTEDYPSSYAGLGNGSKSIEVEGLWSRLKKWYDEKHLMVVPVVYESANPYNVLDGSHGRVASQVNQSYLRLVSRKGTRIANTNVGIVYNRRSSDEEYYIEYDRTSNTYWQHARRNVMESNAVGELHVTQQSSGEKVRYRTDYDVDNVFREDPIYNPFAHKGSYAYSQPTQYAHIGFKIVMLDLEPGYKLAADLYTITSSSYGTTDKLLSIVPPDPANGKLTTSLTKSYLGQYALPRNYRNSLTGGTSAYDAFYNSYGMDMMSDAASDGPLQDTIRLSPIEDLRWCIDIDERDEFIEDISINGEPDSNKFDVVIYKDTIGAIAADYKKTDDEYRFLCRNDGPMSPDINGDGIDDYQSCLFMDDELPVSYYNATDGTLTRMRGGWSMPNGTGQSFWTGNADSRRLNNHPPVSNPVIPVVSTRSNLKEMQTQGMAQVALGVQPVLDGQVNFEVRVNNNVPSSRINKWQIRFGQAATIRTNNGKLYTDLRVLGVNISKDEDFFTISIGAKAPTIINEIERRTR